MNQICETLITGFESRPNRTIYQRVRLVNRVEGQREIRTSERNVNLFEREREREALVGTENQRGERKEEREERREE